MGIPHKNIDNLEEGRRFIKAIILVIDWKRKKVIKEIAYEPPPGHLGAGISRMFKGACIFKNRYYVVTNTELLEYDLNNWRLQRVVSHPSFNDLHGVFVDANYTYLCNTGLEVVQLLKNGRIIQAINMADTPTGERFSEKKDYRTVPNTKPHEAHINHICAFNKKLWVTRFQKRDAVALLDKSQKISMPVDAGCHDGKVMGESVFFTTVNGHILEFDTHTLRLKKGYNINTYTNRGIGWTRGLEIHGGYAYLGISALRHSRFKEYAKGIIKGRENQLMPSSLLKIDYRNEKIVDQFNIPYRRAAVYTILKHPES